MYRPPTNSSPAVESHFRGFIEASLDAFFLFAAVRGGDGAIVDFRLVELNRRAEVLSRREREALSGVLLSQLLPATRELGIIDQYRAVVEGGPAFEEERQVPTANGERWFRHQVVRAEDGIAVAVRDITGRRRVEESLRQSEASFRHLIESATDGIYRIDPFGYFTYANPVASRVLGLSDSGLVGRLYLEFVRRDYAEQAIAMYRRQIKERIPVTYWEFPAIRADGEEVWIGQNVHLEQDGDRVTALFAVARDITDRRRMEDELRHAQKLEAVGQLAGGIAHDFNNLLTAIRGFSDILFKSISADDPRHADVYEICRAADQASALTRQLLAFSRRQVLRPEVLNLNTAVTELSRIIARLLGERVELSVHLDPALWRVRADPGQLEQVLLNLAVNARDAMAATGGAFTIETFNLETRGDAAEPSERGRFAVLRVTDTGVGMTPDVARRVFEPFFTTKDRGKGTGLGLSTVYGIVTQSGGHITVDSEAGQGASFTIHLPAVDTAPAHRRSLGTPAIAGPGSGTILVAEDNDGVLLLTERVLGESGYRVLTARDGAEALAIAMRADEQIDLLITDVLMPRIGGSELANRFAVLRPDTPIVFMSGYTDEDTIRRTFDDPTIPFLQKPFTAPQLLAVAAKLLPTRT